MLSLKTSRDHPLWVKARQFAELAHSGEFRKFTKAPYHVHPHHVAEMLAEEIDDPEVVAAGETHDVIENERDTYEGIAAHLGEPVANLTIELTHTHKKVNGVYVGTREERAANELARLSKISPRAASIKICDIMENVPSMAQYNPDFARRVYVPEKLAQLEVLKGGNRILWERASAMLNSIAIQLRVRR